MMYILNEDEYQQLNSAAAAGFAGQDRLPQFIARFAFFECPECGRLVAMETSKKDTARDAKTLAQGCPGCGENVNPSTLTAAELIKRVLG